MGNTALLKVTTTPTAIFEADGNTTVRTLALANLGSTFSVVNVDFLRGGVEYKILGDFSLPGRKTVSVFLSKDINLYLEDGDAILVSADKADKVSAMLAYDDGGQSPSTSSSSSFGPSTSSSSSFGSSSSSNSIPPPPPGSSSTSSFPSSYTVSNFNAQQITSNPDYNTFGICSDEWTSKRLWMYEINGIYTFRFLDPSGNPVYGKDGSGCWELEGEDPGPGTYNYNPGVLPGSCGGVVDGPWWLSRSAVDAAGNVVWAISSGLTGPGQIAYKMASIYRMEGGIQQPFVDENDDYTRLPTSRNSLCCANNPSCDPLSEGQIVLSGSGCNGFGVGYYPWEIQSTTHACSRPCGNLPDSGDQLTDIGTCWGSVS